MRPTMMRNAQTNDDPLDREACMYMDILIDMEYAPIQEDGQSLDLVFVEDIAKFTLDLMDVPDTSEVSITFVDDDRMAELNELYRMKIGPTDVLSFECDNLDDGFACEVGGIFCLGDIVIAPDVAYRQSIEYGNTYKEELALLIVHGLLHLLGFDHIEDDEAEIMESKQKEILDAMRIRFSLVS